jgi:LmbE family N-acetylglucosaminyl deacetylase
MSPRWVRNALHLAMLDIERFNGAHVVDLPPGARVLVLAPHPDDESIGCGGLMRKYVTNGVSVKVVVMTDGRLGDPELRRMAPRDPARLSDEEALVARRIDEFQNALGVLGVEEWECLGFPDGELRTHVGATAGRLSCIMDAWRPDTVLLPFLTDRHEDHFATNSCLIAAAALAKAPWPKQLFCLGYEIWSPIYANLHVDIGAVMDIKRQAIRCHASQLRHDDYLGGIEGLNRYRAVSSLAPSAYAEAYFAAPLPVYQDLYDKILR